MQEEKELVAVYTCSEPHQEASLVLHLSILICYRAAEEINGAIAQGLCLQCGRPRFRDRITKKSSLRADPDQAE